MSKNHKFIEETIVELLKKELRPKSDITIDTNLGKLGLNSIDVIEVVMCLEDTFKIDITSDEDNTLDNILKKDTIHELADYIDKKIKGNKFPYPEQLI